MPIIKREAVDASVKEQLTVNALIKKLQEIKKHGGGELKVWADGCDCIGEAHDVSIKDYGEPHGKYVIVER